MLPKTRLDEITTLADRIRLTLGLPPIPIDLPAVIKQLGGSLSTHENPLTEPQIRKLDKGFVIEVAHSVNADRQQFVIARQLGHLFLHLGYIVDPSYWATASVYQDSPKHRVGYITEDLEASWFASVFLMPEPEFRKVVMEQWTPEGYRLSTIAKTFGVTTTAAKQRGIHLELFAWT